MFRNRMQTAAIPKRVYALCREVANKPMDEVTLKSLLEPQNLGGKTPYFRIVKAAAEELQLISTKENRIVIAVDKDVIKSMDNMKHYINLKLENFSEGLFYKVTQGYLDLETKVFEYNSVSKMSDLIGDTIGEKITEDDMRAWRFWMAFLGFGYIHDSQIGAAGILLPNVAGFLRDIIDSLEIKKKTEFRIDEFVSAIIPYANITLHKAEETKSFNYAFSNGLRMLNDLGYINIEHRLDAQEIWALYPCEGHELDTTITHVTIGG